MRNYGRADFDTPHRLITNFVWEIPYRHEGIAGALFSGWGVSGVLTVQSGDPLTLSSANSGTIFGATSGNAQMCPGFTYDDIVVSGSTSSKLNQYFNASAVNCLPSAIGNGYDWGNSGRNVIFGPSVRNIDMSLMRSFKMKGSDNNSVQFRAEFYNATNTPQFSNPNTTVTSATFGTITSTVRNPRLVQFALKYVF
jgi:hypothetical protein